MAANLKREGTPVAEPGDRIVVESERVGEHPREGEILEVADTPYGPTFEVRWEDGHRSGFRPAAGSARIIRAAKHAVAKR
jgi:hypothetical protein